MAYLALLAAAAGFGLALAAFGSALGLGRAVSAAMESMARQPEAAGQIQTGMIIGAALIEALTIYALVAAILFWIKLPNPEALLEALKGIGG